MGNATEIDAEAARWLAKRDSESWSAKNQAVFEAWLTGSVAHRVAFIRVEAAWNHASRLKELGIHRAG